MSEVQDEELKHSKSLHLYTEKKMPLLWHGNTDEKVTGPAL